MAEKDFKSAVAFSKTIMPWSMRRLVLADDDGLLFLGSENLQSMVDEWKLIEKASTIAISATKRMNRDYKEKRSTEFFEHEVKKAKDAQDRLLALMEQSESKPLFCDRRLSPKEFAIGETVFVSFTDEDFFSECIVAGYKGKEIVLSVETYDEDGNEATDEGFVLFTSEYLYKADDIKYLALHPEYFSLFISYLRLDDNTAQKLFTMIEDCVMAYYPETKDEIMRMLTEIAESSDDTESNDANTTSAAT